MDDRAQSIGIARFFMTIGVGAVCLFLLTTVGDPMLNSSQNATNNATANMGTTYLSQAMDLAPFLIVLAALIGVVMLAVYQREIRG